MSSATEKRRWLRFAASLLLLAIFVKLLWVGVELLWLPGTGVEYGKRAGFHPLPTRYRLVSDEALPPPKPKKSAPIDTGIRGMELLATYVEGGSRIAVISKGKQTDVAREGEELFGFRLEQVADKEAILSKNGKEYRLAIEERPLGKAVESGSPKKFLSPKKGLRPPGTPPPEIRKEGDRILVPRILVERYSSDLKHIAREISIQPKKEGGKLVGFQVAYIRKGSVFEKLGLKRGDLITAVNGEALHDYRVPMELFRSAETLDDLTIEIQRGNQKMELQYEME